MMGGDAAGEEEVRRKGRVVFGPLNAFDLCTDPPLPTPRLRALPLLQLIDSNDCVCVGVCM